MLWAGYIAQLYATKIEEKAATKRAVHPSKKDIKTVEEGGTEASPIETVSARVAQTENVNNRADAQANDVPNRAAGARDSAISIRL